VDARLLGAETNKRLVERALASGRLQDEAGLRGCKALVITTRGMYPSSISPQGLARRLATQFPPKSRNPHVVPGGVIDSSEKRMLY